MRTRAPTRRIERNGGFQVKGIFRIAADKGEVRKLQRKFEKGQFTVLSDDPNVPADLLKHWLRDLAEPLIPTTMYEECLATSKHPDKCVALMKEKLPKQNIEVMAYLINFLQRLEKHKAVTAMTSDNLGIVFCQDLLRHNDMDPAELFKNSNQEKQFVKNLIDKWPSQL